MKYAWIESQAGWQPIARLCKVLGVSRSGFLQWRKRGPSDRELANRSLDAQVAVIHAEGKQGYGRIRVTRRLHQSGMRVGAERVIRDRRGPGASLMADEITPRRFQCMERAPQRR